jgi:hypothetical protein
LCEVNNVHKNFFDSEKTSQSQKGVRNMGILRYRMSTWVVTAIALLPESWIFFRKQQIEQQR